MTRDMAAFRPALRKVVALIQLLFMVMLAVPACGYELVFDHGAPEVCISAGAVDTAPDECPCCPGENQSGGDDCSTCDYCSFYTPLTYAPLVDYLPSVAQLVVHDHYTKLREVHIPIFVPPQNFA